MISKALRATTEGMLFELNNLNPTSLEILTTIEGRIYTNGVEYRAVGGEGFKPVKLDDFEWEKMQSILKDYGAKGRVSIVCYPEDERYADLTFHYLSYERVQRLRLNVTRFPWNMRKKAEETDEEYSIEGKVEFTEEEMEHASLDDMCINIMEVEDLRRVELRLYDEDGNLLAYDHYESMV